MEIKIGADPEIFVKDETGKLISAYGLVKGTKATPYPVVGGAVQVDGMALEFNIDPATRGSEFTNSINGVMSQLRDMLPFGYTFHIEPVAEFGKDYIDKQPDEAKLLGCDPDYNAYTGDVNPRPNGDGGIRTASGHIHVGWTKDMDPHDPGHFEACRMLTKQLDMALAFPSIVWDRNVTRRSMYGMLGSFRPKSYGVEYRVLSNMWLTNKLLMNYVFSATMSATNQLLKGNKYYTSLPNPQTAFASINPLGAYDYYQMYGGPQTAELNNFMWNMTKGDVIKPTKKTRAFPNVRVDDPFEELAEAVAAIDNVQANEVAQPRRLVDLAPAQLRWVGLRQDNNI